MIIGRLLLLATLLLAGTRTRAQQEPERSYQMRRSGEAQVEQLIVYENEESPSRGFTILRATASTRKLLRLAYQSDPALKLYAALALADRKYPKLYEVLGEIIRADQRITLHLTNPDNGRVIIRKSYSSAKIYDRFYYSSLYQKFTTQDSLNHARQLLSMDSVVLHLASQGYPLDERTLEMACYTNAAYPGSYPAVRQLCLDMVETKYSSAPLAQALAAYRKKADVPLIARFKQWSLWDAATQFPDPAFWPLLQPSVGKEHTYGFYSAIASYQNPAAAHLLDSIYRHKLYYDDGRLRHTLSQLSQALSSHYHPVFDSLIVKLWWQQQLITPSEVARFTERDERKAAAIFFRGLLRFSAAGNTYLVSGEAAFNAEQLMQSLLRPIQQHDSLAFRSVAQHGLTVFSGPELAALCGIIRQHRATWATPALLARIAAEDNPLALFTASETLLAIENAAVRRQVRELLAKKSVRAFSGNWPARFNALLQSSGLLPLTL